MRIVIVRRERTGVRVKKGKIVRKKLVSRRIVRRGFLLFRKKFISSFNFRTLEDELTKRKYSNFGVSIVDEG